MLKKIAVALLIVLVVIQFIRPEKNLSNDQTFAIGTKYSVPDDVKNILENGCYNCHSNKSDYPWYSAVQPFAWWLDHHIQEGKRELNFSAFAKLPVAVQNHKFEEIAEEVKEKKMPLPSYTNFGLHPEANLSDDQRQKLITWAQEQMESLKNQYPADSLKMKR